MFDKNRRSIAWCTNVKEENGPPTFTTDPFPSSGFHKVNYRKCRNTPPIIGVECLLLRLRITYVLDRVTVNVTVIIWTITLGSDKVIFGYEHNVVRGRGGKTVTGDIIFS